jgi:hypothetical protein
MIDQIVAVMNKVKFAVSFVTGAFVVFTILCSPAVAFPIGFLLLFLFILQVSLVWMILTILKSGTPSNHTFDEKFYEDRWDRS